MASTNTGGRPSCYFYMKIQLLSDLHLEVNPAFQPRPAPDADLLVLAGDIGALSRNASLTAEFEFGLERFVDWPVPVLVVPGNHEYDHQDFNHAHARLRHMCTRLGLIWLERQSHIHAGVRFLGTTLWADFDALAKRALTPESEALEREKAFRAANHYLCKAGTTLNGAPFLAPQMRQLSLACQDWLKTALCQPHDGPTVVVTHFAPSLRSHDPRYGLTPGTAGFCNALDPLLQHADLWVHGHLHCPVDYQAGRCRVVANPLGYAHKGEQTHFNPHAVISLPDSISTP